MNITINNSRPFGHNFLRAQARRAVDSFLEAHKAGITTRDVQEYIRELEAVLPKCKGDDIIRTEERLKYLKELGYES